MRAKQATLNKGCRQVCIRSSLVSSPSNSYLRSCEQLFACEVMQINIRHLYLFISHNTIPCFKSYSCPSSFWFLNMASLCLPQRKLWLSPCTSLCLCVFARLVLSPSIGLSSLSQRNSLTKWSGWSHTPHAGHSLSRFCLFVFHSIDHWNHFPEFFYLLNYFLTFGYKSHEQKDLVCLVHCCKAISSNRTWHIVGTKRLLSKSDLWLSIL